jgi:hypothetical protein
MKFLMFLQVTVLSSDPEDDGTKTLTYVRNYIPDTASHS